MTATTRPTTARRLSAVLAVALLAGPAAAEEEWAPGEKLTLVNCGRCHVIGPRNRMGGISSTPSFMVIRTWENWEDKARAFWTLNPHPAFTQIEGVTPPFPPDRPSPIHPIALTPDDVDAIVAFMRTVEPADLGEELGVR